MASNVSWSEALMAMIAMLTVLTFVLIYYCFVPCYRLICKRRREEEEWWENDPRWNGDKFSFMPRMPKDYKNDAKYSRLAAVSRTSSMRSDVEQNCTTTNKELADNRVRLPPPYSERSSQSSLGNPPSYASKTPSVDISSETSTPKSASSRQAEPRAAKAKAVVTNVTRADVNSEGAPKTMPRPPPKTSKVIKPKAKETKDEA